MPPLPRLETRQLLRPADIEPSHPSLEVVGAFNPGAADFNGEVVLLVRVAERPIERRPGSVGLPRWCPVLGPQIDWVAEEDLTFLDPRVVRVHRTGLVRLTFTSHLRAIRCGPDGLTPRLRPETIKPTSELEEYGVEDPRITPLGQEDVYAITYVSVSRHGASTSLMTTKDFRSFERLGVIFPPENKDVLLFPETVNDRYVALHRPNAATPFTRPEMWTATSPDLLSWGDHKPMMLSLQSDDWRSGRVGGGTPPIRTGEGWLTIYHGNTHPTRPGEVGAYRAGALLLDFEDPSRILRQSTDPVMQPETPFERTGFVPDVVFPTGVVERGERILVYYGAADESVGVVAFSRNELLASLV